VYLNSALDKLNSQSAKSNQQQPTTDNRQLAATPNTQTTEIADSNTVCGIQKRFAPSDHRDKH